MASATRVFHPAPDPLGCLALLEASEEELGPVLKRFFRKRV
jgi:hypothetical protein